MANYKLDNFVAYPSTGDVQIRLYDKNNVLRYNVDSSMLYFYYKKDIVYINDNNNIIKLDFPTENDAMLALQKLNTVKSHFYLLSKNVNLQELYTILLDYSFTSHTHMLSGLTDVLLKGTTEGQILKYSGGTWINSEMLETLFLKDLKDVDVSGTTEGQILKYSGGTWINSEMLETLFLKDLKDVTISGETTGQVLFFSGDTWLNIVLESNHIKLGIPSDGTYNEGLLPFTSGTPVSDAVDDINEILNKLAPAKPRNLDNVLLGITYSYDAYRSDVVSLTLDQICTDVLQPIISAANFYDGDSGTLSAEIDFVNRGSIILTTNTDTGQTGSLIIVSDTDPYAGQAGKEGFWRQLTANIVSDSALTYTGHTYKMKHSGTGNSQILTVWVDDPGVVSVSNTVHTLPLVGTLRYISGVPSLSQSTNIGITYDVVNAVRKHYSNLYVTTVNSNSVTNSLQLNPVYVPTDGETLSFSNNLTTLNGVYTENIIISIRGYNSKNVGGTISTTPTSSRIDTISDETNRKTSGSGQYPIIGYTSSFDNTQSLKTVYTEELQMLTGYIRRPTLNYTSNLPLAGEDYSTGMGTQVRWVTYNLVSLSNNSSFKINFINTVGTWNGVNNVTSGMYIFAKVEGVTGWIDCNNPYPGVGNPSIDGDYSMVLSESSYIMKKVTFGTTTRSGALYVRIGLVDGSDKKFSNITITNVV